MRYQAALRSDRLPPTFGGRCTKTEPARRNVRHALRRARLAAPPIPAGFPQVRPEDAPLPRRPWSAGELAGQVVRRPTRAPKPTQEAPVLPARAVLAPRLPPPARRRTAV